MCSILCRGGCCFFNFYQNPKCTYDIGHDLYIQLKMCHNHNFIWNMKNSTYTQLPFWRYLWCTFWVFSLDNCMSNSLTWRRQGLWSILQPATRGRWRCFGLTFGEKTCHPSLYTGCILCIHMSQFFWCVPLLPPVGWWCVGNNLLWLVFNLIKCTCPNYNEPMSKVSYDPDRRGSSALYCPATTHFMLANVDTSVKQYRILPSVKNTKSIS